MTRTTRPAPRLRRLPAPACEPPFDDERGGPGATGWSQGALALAYRLPGGLPVEPEPPAQLRLVLDLPVRPPGAGRAPAVGAAPPAPADDAFERRRPTSTADLPEARRWATQLAQGLVEVLSGHRPAQQLLRWTDEGVYARLLQATRSLARRPVTSRGRTGRPGLRVVRVCEPLDGVVEASAVVSYGSRCRALAFRLEGLDGRWRCTAYDLL